MHDLSPEEVRVLGCLLEKQRTTPDTYPLTLNALRAVDDGPTRAAVTAERVVLAILEGGCSLPVGALAKVSGATLTIESVVCSPEGEEEIRESVAGQAADPETAGQQLAGLLLERGAARLLKQHSAASR